VKHRMLKKASGFVLASFRPSTYPRGYASVPHLLRPCRRTFLTILQQDQLGNYACDMHNDGRTSLGD
jgi:hypothetical protein